MTPLPPGWVRDEAHSIERPEWERWWWLRDGILAQLRRAEGVTIIADVYRADLADTTREEALPGWRAVVAMVEWLAGGGDA